ncbi:MAG TPA: GGDEF domain-containing protein [Terracidiphilus sp.]|nr:GGDEF domain-containing protein [Terracidiphilus sp.]
MPTQVSPTYLLASPDPVLLATIEPVLLAAGAQVEIVLSAEAALASLEKPRPLALALLDATLPGLDPSMNIERLLATVRAEESAVRLPIVLISDTVTQDWIDRLAEGVIDDLILRTAEAPYWRLRIEMALRDRHRSRELQTLREAQLLNAQFDRLTGVYNRETILAMLFRETDRVQRMNSALSLLLLDIDDFGHWNSRLGYDACDDLLCQVAGRIARLLRSYDLLGRPGKDEFLLVLPGCSAVNAVMLAERMRVDVFCSPFRVGGDAIRLSACFGIAGSQGRSPVVVLREAEQALQWARTAGPESIQCFGDCPHTSDGPVAFLSPSTGDELLAW